DQYAARAIERVKPSSPWLAAYLQEDKLHITAPPDLAAKSPTADEKTFAVKHADQCASLAAAYSKATGENLVQAPALGYKVAQLRNWAGGWYRRAGQEAKATQQYEQALPLEEKWTKNTHDPEFFLIQGETLEALKKKTEALGAYRQAMDR